MQAFNSYLVEKEKTICILSSLIDQTTILHSIELVQRGIRKLPEWRVLAAKPRGNLFLLLQCSNIYYIKKLYVLLARLAHVEMTTKGVYFQICGMHLLYLFYVRHLGILYPVHAKVCFVSVFIIPRVS